MVLVPAASTGSGAAQWAATALQCALSPANPPDSVWACSRRAHSWTEVVRAGGLTGPPVRACW